MPELPEVETVVRDLRPLLVGRRLTAFRLGRKALRKAWSKKWTAQVAGRVVRAIERRGKWILIDLDGPFLVVHLGMTGQFRVQPAAHPPENHTHLIAPLDEGIQELRFRDVRRFGSLSFFPDAAALENAFVAAGLGPEPFVLDPGYWRDRLRHTRRCLKAILLDQRVVAGVGNIYADESLFAARLNPRRLGCSLAPVEADRLRRAVATVLTRAIEQRGSSIRDYIGGSGLKGKFQEEFAVYGRTGEPCRRCRTPIACMRLAGRSTHFCPRCQTQAGAR